MPCLLFDVGVFAILELELQIVWNHLNGINLDSSVGQLIPALSVATFAVLRASGLRLFEGPLAKRWTDLVTEVIASYVLRTVKIGEIPSEPNLEFEMTKFFFEQETHCTHSRLVYCIQGL